MINLNSKNNMLNYKIFQDRIELVELNFNIKYPAKLMMVIYEKLKGISDAEFEKGISRVLLTSAEDWNKKYGFGGKPAIGDWLGFFGSKEQSPERKAAIEVARILDYVSYYPGYAVLFDDPYTNATVEMYGGMSKVAWDVDKFNPNKRKTEWISKELKEFWLICFDGNKKKLTPCSGRDKSKIDFIGNKEKWLEITNDSKLTIN